MMVQASANDREIVFAEEAFVVDAQSLLHELMVQKGFSRADLATTMGVSRARVTQILSDDCKNFTVRLFARAMRALGEKPEVTCRWMADQKAAEAKARKRQSITLASNVHELWRDTAVSEESYSPCNDDDARIGGLLHRQLEAGRMAA